MSYPHPHHRRSRCDAPGQAGRFPRVPLFVAALMASVVVAQWHVSTAHPAPQSPRSGSTARAQAPSRAQGEAVALGHQLTYQAASRHRLAEVAVYLTSLEVAHTMALGAAAQASFAASLHAEAVADAVELGAAVQSSQSQAAQMIAGLGTSAGAAGTLPDVISSPTTPVSMSPSASDPPGDTVSDYQRAAWDKVNVCEQGGQWNLDGATHPGGLGFTAANWARFNSFGFPPDAAEASADQQIQVATAFAAYYWGSPNAAPDQDECGSGY